MEREDCLLVNDYKSNVAARTFAKIFGEMFIKDESNFSYNEREDFRMSYSHTISTAAWNYTSFKTVIERKTGGYSILWSPVYEIEIYAKEDVYCSYVSNFFRSYMSRPIFAEIKFMTEYGKRPNEKYSLLFFDLEPFHEVVSWIRDNIALGKKIDDWKFLAGLSSKEGVRANIEAV